LLRQVGPKSNSWARARRLAKIVDADALAKLSDTSRRLVWEWWETTAKVPYLNRDLPFVKENFARYVNTREWPTVPTLMHPSNSQIWAEIAVAVPGEGVHKSGRANEIKWMRCLVRFLENTPFFNRETGSLLYPAPDKIITLKNAELKVQRLIDFAREYQSGNLIDALDFIVKWHKEFYEDEHA
jgi:hypothetical protein